MNIASRFKDTVLNSFSRIIDENPEFGFSGTFVSFNFTAVLHLMETKKDFLSENLVYNY